MNEPPSHGRTTRLQQTLAVAISIIKRVVEADARLRIDVVIDHEAAVTLRVAATKQSFGKLIGKGGQNARALRMLLIAMMGAEKTRVGLDLC